jgi:hypothetical protein
VSDLKPDAEKLVQATRAALKPTDADRERVFAALLPQIGAGLGADGMGAAAQASGPAKVTLLKISAALVGLGVAGGGLYLAFAPEPRPAPAVVSTAVKPAPVVAPPVDQAPEAVLPVAPPAEPAAKKSPGPSRSADNLAQEVAILSRASAELRAGRPAAALKALDEHQREFPGGVLAQERTAARIQALCALGRKKEAESELARLTRTSPSSPHVARARKACGLDVTGEK